MQKHIILILTVVVFTMFSLPVRPVCSADDYSKSAFASDQIKGQQVVETLNITEVLGPLAPVALSPFFGLTCLSATSILSEKTDIIPDNKLITGNRALNNPTVFMVFLVLTIITSLPKLTTMTKVFVQAVDQIETYAGIISYLVIVGLAASSASGDGQEIVYAAGIITFTKSTFLMVACIVNIVVINTVKFFFELLILISPVPTIDAVFEAGNKAFAAILAVLYAFNPWLAFVINLIIFLFCLVVFKWAVKRIRYHRSILLGPAAMAIKKKLFGSSCDPNDGIRDRIAHQIKNAVTVVKVFPDRRIGRIKKIQPCCLVKSDENLLLVKLRLFSAAVIETIDYKTLEISIEKGLVSNCVKVKTPEGKTVYKLTFSKAYNDMLDTIASQLNAKTDQQQQ